ncbi:XdhC family protein [Paracoccus suum]|uniref:XdhC family protein n=1 Tax=Paracoccus suum TaxID=2259340 RepID=UPI0013B0622C|nr:XdhC family protein [Paracoccus suum]
MAPFDAQAAATNRIEVCESDWPLSALTREEVALALITGVDGAAYRPVGAAMAIDAEGRRSGSLSSGCLERDVALHALSVIRDGVPRQLRYGRGSPFLDITLPCGGGLDITVLPAPAPEMVAQIRAQLAARGPVDLAIRPDGCITTGTLAGATFSLRIRPEIRFVILGKGPETASFARIVTHAGYGAEVFTDGETAAEAGIGRPLPAGHWPDDLEIDPYTAVAMFFHDHEHEPLFLARALQSPAFFVGAQGSLRAHQSRCQALAELGVPAERIAALASPFGLIPSTRDPRMLAVSVLAQILSRAAQLQGRT